MNVISNFVLPDRTPWGKAVAALTDGYGVMEGRYEYDVFGVPYEGDLNGGMNLGYTGKPYDGATGLYDYGYRDYMPAAARFTTEDPVRDGANWFAYVNNDPVNWIDPRGLSASDRGKTNNYEIINVQYNSITVTEFAVAGSDQSKYTFTNGPGIIEPEMRGMAVDFSLKEYGGFSGKTRDVTSNTVFEISLSNPNDKLSVGDIKFIMEHGGTIYLSREQSPKGAGRPGPNGFAYVSPVLLQIVDNATGEVSFRRK